MNAVVETRDLTKRFGDHYALAGLTMAVPRGHIVGFLGRNGSGKTTTIKIILDVIRRTSGEATVFGEPTGPSPFGAESDSSARTSGSTRT